MPLPLVCTGFAAYPLLSTMVCAVQRSVCLTLTVLYVTI